jgi:RNA polymerase sporulation-specific sigma factor
MLITKMLLERIIFFALNVETSNTFPKLLQPKEEAELFALMAKGDKKARDKLISHNLRLVAFIVKKYYSNVKDQDDLISIGTIGLIKAVSTFNSDKGNKFATYASKCIANEILMQFRADKKRQGDILIDDRVTTDKDGNQLTFLDIIADGTNINDEVDLLMLAERLREAVCECLTHRELEIIKLRYGLFNAVPLTQKDVAKKLNISRSYVSRIEKKSLNTLRECFGNELEN